MLGMPSIRHFTFTANEVGECDWRMVYARPTEFSFDDEANGKSVNSVQIKITVDEAMQ